jgi:hypothetical protein
MTPGHSGQLRSLRLCDSEHTTRHLGTHMYVSAQTSLGRASTLRCFTEGHRGV